MSIGLPLTIIQQFGVWCIGVPWNIGMHNLMCWLMVLWFIGYKSRVHENPKFEGYATLLLRKKGQKFNNVKVSSCHSAFGKSQNIKNGKGIERNTWWFWIVTIQMLEGKEVIAINDADLIQPLIGLRIKSICLMAFNQSRLSAFISVQSCNS